MCETTQEHRCKPHVATKVLAFFLFVLVVVLALLLQRFDSLLHNTHDLQQENHVIACHIDKQLSDGKTILACQDVNLVGGRK